MSGITLVKESERLVYEGDGFKIFYRRVPSHVRGEIVRRCSPRRGGDPDWAKVSNQFLAYAILDWQGVNEEEEGKMIPAIYDSSKVGYLPDEIQVDLMEKLGANIDKLESDSKNSEAMPASKTKTKDSPASGA